MGILDKYFKQFTRLLQKMIQDGKIDEHDDGEVMMSIYQFEMDVNEIKSILERNPELVDFYNKPKPIQIVEESVESSETFSEEFSIRTLAEYLQEHPEFQSEISQESPFSEYIRDRFQSISEQISIRLNHGLQVPYLDKNEDNSKRIPIGYLTYSHSQAGAGFVLEMNDGSIKDMGMFDAMPLVFNYLYQRRNISYFKSQNNTETLDKIPIGYREPIKYSIKTADISYIDDSMDFLR